jgi:hypothetical protein
VGVSSTTNLKKLKTEHQRLAALREQLRTDEQELYVQVHTATAYDTEHRGFLANRTLELGAATEREKIIEFADKALLDAKKILAAATTESHEYTAKVCALQEQMRELLKEEKTQKLILRAQQLKVETLMERKECALVWDDRLRGTQKMDELRTQRDPLTCLAGAGKSPYTDAELVKIYQTSAVY